MARISLADLIGRLQGSHQDLDEIEVDLDDNGEDLGTVTPIRLAATASEERKPDPEVVKLRQELKLERERREQDNARRDAERREEKLSAIDKDVEVFVAGEKAANRVNGEEQVKALRLALKQAAVDDLDHPIKDHSRFATLKAVQLAAKPHGSTSEQIANGKRPNDTSLLSNKGEGYDPTAAARAQNDKFFKKVGQAAS
jgi:hypothetical protein